MEVKDALTLHEVELASKLNRKEFGKWWQDNPNEARQVVLKLIVNQTKLAVSTPRLIPLCKFLMECTDPNYYNLKLEKATTTALFDFGSKVPKREKPVKE